MSELPPKNSSAWEAVKEALIPEGPGEEWLKLIDNFVNISERIKDPAHQDFETIAPLEDEREEIITAYHNSIWTAKDVKGFVFSVDHENEEVRVVAASATREVFESDPSRIELAKIAFNKLTHDNSTLVREFALEDIMIMLWGRGICSIGSPAELSESEREALEDIFASSLQHINSAVDTNILFTKTDT